MQIGAQIKAELTHKGLGGAVDVAAKIRPVAGNGADIDNVADIALHHRRQQGAGHIDQPFIVGVDHGFPVFDAGLVRWLHAQRQPGVVHQNIDLAPFRRQRRHGGFNGGAIAHVKLQGIEIVAQLRLQGIQTVLTASGRDNFMARSDKTTGNTLTKASGSAGNKNYHLTVPQQIFQVKHHSTSFCRCTGPIKPYPARRILVLCTARLPIQRAGGGGAGAIFSRLRSLHIKSHRPPFRQAFAQSIS